MKQFALVSDDRVPEYIAIIENISFVFIARFGFVRLAESTQL